jgi:hypothetical protein
MNLFDWYLLFWILWAILDLTYCPKLLLLYCPAVGLVGSVRTDQKKGSLRFASFSLAWNNISCYFNTAIITALPDSSGNPIERRIKRVDITNEKDPISRYR